MRIITVDNGNTNPHVGIFQEQKLVSVVPLKDFSLLPDDFILVSDVGAPLPFAPSFDLKSIRSGEKRWNWVRRGCPIIVEIGPRDAAGFGP